MSHPSCPKTRNLRRTRIPLRNSLLIPPSKQSSIRSTSSWSALIQISPKRSSSSRRKATKRQARLLQKNPCHMVGLAIHFNQDGKVHEDLKSLNSGQDFVIPLGQHSGCKFELPQINASVDFNVTDMGMLRGGGMKHLAKDWEGRGRMVMVPFVEKQLFHHKGVSRPWQFRRFYQEHFSELRSRFPAVPLSSL
jgi:hypothetical protein